MPYTSRTLFFLEFPAETYQTDKQTVGSLNEAAHRMARRIVLSPERDVPSLQHDGELGWTDELLQD